MNFRRSTAALLVSLIATPVLASDNTDMFYVGGSVGGVVYDLGDMENSLDAAAATANATPGITASSEVDDFEVAFGLQLGYQFNRYVAMELGYRNYGEAETSLTATDGTDNFLSETNISASGLGIGLLGFIPIGETFNLYGRLDAVNLRSRAGAMLVDTSTGTFLRGSVVDTDVKLGYGIGMQWNSENCTALRIEANYIEGGLSELPVQDEWSLTSISVGLLKSF